MTLSGIMKGVYVLGYVKDVSTSLLTSPERLKSVVTLVCERLKLNIIEEKHHKFGGAGGITYCFVLSQSHFVIHTWPEESRMFFDIFSCNGNLDEQKCAEALIAECGGVLGEIKKVEQQ